MSLYEPLRALISLYEPLRALINWGSPDLVDKGGGMREKEHKYGNE